MNKHKVPNNVMYLESHIGKDPFNGVALKNSKFFRRVKER